ncbi:MAG TPA: hypothetical protein VMV32_02095, partial [Ignavibacteriaceae bacterium]|nr:hypothetical protein [Ignavibacteriaceae bacterium]
STMLYFISPKVLTKESFFKGASLSMTKPGYAMLTFSLVISWIFAKSVTNVSNLGMQFGFVGGVAYATYYLSFLVAGIVIYKIRTKTNVNSLHQFLEKKFGRGAIVAFTIVIAIRLLNEIWSNTEVIGSYFGASGSPQYIASIVVFTGLTLAYTIKGGFRTSLVTDLIQMGLFAVLLFIVLSLIIPKTGSVTPFIKTGSWTLTGGVDLIFVALIQIFSYPFHDPILTDRGFLTDPKTTLKSYITATVISSIIILLFSFVGIYGSFAGLKGEAAVEVSKSFGVFTLIVMNFIMVTSASSCIDSTFSSVSKLIAVDLSNKEKISISKGRITMILTAIGGTIPLIFSPSILSATTLSGTMVLGLAPVFLLWKVPAPKISFHLALWTGVAAGIVLVFGLLPKSLYFGNGSFADLLAINIYATLIIFILYFLPFIFSKKENMINVVEN